MREPPAVSLILDVAAHELIRPRAGQDSERLALSPSKTTLIGAVIRLAGGATRAAVAREVCPRLDSLAARRTLLVQINQLEHLIRELGWPALFVGRFGPKGGVYRGRVLRFAMLVIVENAGPKPLMVPDALRGRLVRLLLSHPDEDAVDRLFDHMDV